jgi:hypothetical protein
LNLGWLMSDEEVNLLTPSRGEIHPNYSLRGASFA